MSTAPELRVVLHQAIKHVRNAENALATAYDTLAEAQDVWSDDYAEVLDDSTTSQVTDLYETSATDLGEAQTITQAVSEKLKITLARLGDSAVAGTIVKSPEVGEQAELSDEHRRAIAPYQRQLIAIDKALDDGQDPAAIPGYITSGGRCYVFETADKDYVIKVPRVEFLDDPTFSEEPMPPLLRDVAITSYYIPLMLGKGEESLAQIKDFGYVPPTSVTSNGAIIVKKIRGKTVDEMRQPELDAIPQAHYRKLFSSFEMMTDTHLFSAYTGDNVMYVPGQGFVFPDYQVVAPGQPSRTAESSAQHFSGLLQKNPSEPISDALSNFLVICKQTYGKEVTDGVISNHLKRQNYIQAKEA